MTQKIVKPLSKKEKLAQKVLIRTINEFLRRNLFSLAANDNNWSESDVIRFDMCGIPAIASVHDAGHAELSIKVALWPTAAGERLIRAAILSAHGRRAMGGFYAHAWLERKKGAWLQTSNGLDQVSCSQSRRIEVENMPWEDPLGYDSEGRFFI